MNDQNDEKYDRRNETVHEFIERMRYERKEINRYDKELLRLEREKGRITRKMLATIFMHQMGFPIRRK